ncbi:MAG: hypothetical protein C0609_01175 [Deltaproteobacteria bacterium]|nr:MAG: hypothetical protein C0609_01175 [Deltaproteobacteria bacterium]
MNRPFTPPSTEGETLDQLRNLYKSMKSFQRISQLNDPSDIDSVRRKVNEIIALLSEVTRATNVRRK